MTETARILAALQTHRVPIATELAFQEGVAELLRGIGVAFERERILTPRDRIDFLTVDGLGIELKIDGGRNDVLRQLLRYTEHDDIKALLLITTRSKHRDMLNTLGGKPLAVYQVISL